MTSTSAANSPKISYRPDVDGLRAIAVLGVVLFHAGLGMPGGFVGVDIFFVISGFLITSLILKDLQAGSFSFLDFWERRARRILPALSVLVLATLVAGWFLLLPADYRSLASSVIALGVAASNVQFWRKTGYFQTAAEEVPLLHTWSLSVEEQFYILIPIFLFILFRIGRSSWVVLALGAGALLSFGLSCYTVERSPSATFYLLPTRAWELAAGSLLAFARPIPNDRLRSIMAWGGAAAVLLPFFLYAPGIRFPGLTALPPVAGTALLIWSGMRLQSGTPPLPLKILAWRPLVWIGLLSYSLYLWHWPLFAYYRYLHSSPPGGLMSVVFVVLSFVLAWLSLRFVERPFRSRSVISSRNLIFSLSAATVVPLLLIAFILRESGGVPQRVPPEVRQITAAIKDETYLIDMTPGDVPDNFIPLGSKEVSPEILVWGDSHAMAILPGINAACEEMGIAGVAATSSATVPVLEWYLRNRYGLSEEAPIFNQAVMDYIREAAENGSLRQVILAARWTVYLDDDERREGLGKALAVTIREIRDVGCEVILVKEVPTFPRDVPRSLVLYRMVGWDSLLPVLEPDLHFEVSQVQDTLFADLLKNGPDGIRIFDPLDFLVFSNGHIQPVDEEGAPLYWDDNHLSVIGSLRLREAFLGFF